MLVSLCGQAALKVTIRYARIAQCEDDQARSYRRRLMVERFDQILPSLDAAG